MNTELINLRHSISEKSLTNLKEMEQRDSLIAQKYRTMIEQLE